MVQNVSTAASNGSIASNVHLERSCTVKDLHSDTIDNLLPYKKFRFQTSSLCHQSSSSTLWTQSQFIHLYACTVIRERNEKTELFLCGSDPGLCPPISYRCSLVEVQMWVKIAPLLHQCQDLLTTSVLLNPWCVHTECLILDAHNFSLGARGFKSS